MNLSEFQIPLWIKIVYTLFLVVLVPVYWRKWGLANFLWLSDVTLLLTCLSLWMESKLLASTIAVTGLLPELFWNVEFFLRLFTGRRITGLADYMFDSSKKLSLRLLSLFHVFLPVIMIFLVQRLGYDTQGLWYAVLLTTIVFLLTYFFTDENENINMVFGMREKSNRKLPGLVHLLFYTTGMIVLIFIPTHFFLKHFF
jgi:hypothetical protein